MDCQKLFSERFKIIYQESVWPRFDSFIGHAKNYSIKTVPEIICDACGTGHNLRRVNSIHNSQQSTRNSQNLRNKLGSR